LRYLVDQGISPCIVGAWGYFMPWMGVEKLERHWRYLIARYGAMPVMWCGAGEANLPWYLAPGFPFDDREQVHQWTEVLRYIRQSDPFHRLLTIHPTAINSFSSRHATDDPALLDFDMLQTPHGEEGAAEGALGQMTESYAALPQMPVIDGEAAYEMLNDSLPTEWTRAMFWICMTSGAAGHTYGANGIWQNNRPGDPHGRSPNGPGYGKIPSQEAMHLPGSEQLGMAKALFEKYPWYQFVPHPEWAVYEKPGPWTKSSPSEMRIGPLTTGIPGAVRLTYVLRAEQIVARDLGPNSLHTAHLFDPVSGHTIDLGVLRANASGEWSCRPPDGWNHDWVLVMEPVKKS
jgi:hypothetical protein